MKTRQKESDHNDKKRESECITGSDKWMKVPLARVLIENKTTKMNNKNTYLATVIHVVLLV